MTEVRLLNETEYKSDKLSSVLFEDEHSFSFAKIELKNASLKFGWNSKGTDPQIKFINDSSVVFVGVDTYIVGYDYSKNVITLFLNTSTNFKWFDDIRNGVAIVSETSVIMLNVTNRCTLRSCFFFGDIIMGTQLVNNKMRISFLGDDDEFITI